jgi:Zn-dependent metalloprotease
MTRVLLSICFYIAILTTTFAQKTIKYPSTQEYRLLSSLDKPVGPSDFFSEYGSKMGLGQDDHMILQQETAGLNDYIHYKYTQHHKGLPVYGMAYILHTKDGLVRSANGSFAPRLYVDIHPALTIEESIEIAKQDMGSKHYPWEVDSSRAGVSKEKPSPQLCIIDKGLTRTTGIHKLVYRMDLYSAEPLDGQQYFIDAHTGEILHKVELFHTLGVPGQCQTRYYGTQELIVDSTAANNYVLFDETRGIDGQGVIDFDNTFFTSTTRDFDTDNDGYLKGAMDAHFCTTKLYDALQEHFDWQGLDGQNASFKVGVFARGQEDFVNAFWNGDTAWIGNGNCNNGPLATMEVVAHEFMHGIIDFSSDLIYADESGAINESFADVIGHVMEFLEDEENFSWNLNSFILNEDVEPFRVMDNPKVKEHPALYKGEFWVDGADVHTNSSIGNLLYVLLSDGRQGANELGEVYSVEGMGKLEAAKFLFHVNRNYLTPSSTYNDYYQASLIAADEWWDGDSAAIDNLIAAWGYVGLPTFLGDVNDLSIDSDGFYTNCGFGNAVSTYFEITNVGAFDYVENRNATVVITEGFGVGEFITEIAITDSILVGETLRVELDTVYVAEERFAVLNYVLNYSEDEVESNNEEDDFISTTEFVENDISISINPTVVDCFETEADIEFLLINRSCETIDIGTEVAVIIRNTSTGEIIIEEDIVLTERIIPNGRISFVRTRAVEASTRFEMEAIVEYADDPNPNNNSAREDFLVIATSFRDYFNGFDDAAAVFEGLGLETATASPVTVASYQQESYYWATGIFDTSDEVLCAEPEDNFTGEVDFFSGIAAALTACADLRDEDHPTLNFNLVQFRNDNIEHPSPLSSALEVRWGTDTDQKVYIYDQEEGALVNHQIALPPNYVGPIEFRFMTLTGDDNPNNLFNFDSQLLDNLHYGNSVSTEDQQEQRIKIIPNPAHASIFVSSSQSIDIKSLRLIDLSGRIIASGSSAHLDVSHIADGHYQLEVLTQKGETFQETLIIIKP